MNYLPQVISAKRVRGFIIATRFDDGSEKHVDISQWFKGPVFKPLKDSNFFNPIFNKLVNIFGVDDHYRLFTGVLPNLMHMNTLHHQSDFDGISYWRVQWLEAIMPDCES